MAKARQRLIAVKGAYEDVSTTFNHVRETIMFRCVGFYVVVGIFKNVLGLTYLIVVHTTFVKNTKESHLLYNIV